MIQKHSKQLLSATTAILMMISITYAASYAYAEEDDFVTVTKDNIKDNPTLAQILENIEKSKQEFSDAQQKSDQEKLLDEQRNMAQKILEQELQQMFKDNEEFTPLSAFSKFLKTIPDDDTKTVFQGLFDYHQQKVNDARDAMRAVLLSGGTLQDARNAYHEAAKIPRTEMIGIVKDMNVGVGFADPDIQKHFDDDGKLPRYDDEQDSVTSFVDLTSSSSKNVNSSSNVKEESGDIPAQDDTDTHNEASDKTTMQQLLDEIQKLKDKIKELQAGQNSNIQNAKFEKPALDSIHFADWISDYSQGLGHFSGSVKDIKSIPVNALNAPDSYDDATHSLALGREGQVTMGFSESVTDKLIVYEASTEKYIREIATVEVSADGKNWTTLTKTQHQRDNSYVDQYIYDLSEVGCISHVRITDNAPSNWGDGFDVDALGATKLCSNST